MNDSTPPPKAKRGGKKGCKIDLLQLTSGGSGRQYCQNDCSEWNFEKKESDNSSIDLYSMSSYSSVDDLEDYDGQEFCLSRKLQKLFERRCAAEGVH